MAGSKEYSSNELLAMLAGPESVGTLPEGLVRVERAGVVGTGPTLQAARADWGRQFFQAVTHAKPGAASADRSGSGS